MERRCLESLATDPAVEIRVCAHVPPAETADAGPDDEIRRLDICLHFLSFRPDVATRSRVVQNE